MIPQVKLWNVRVRNDAGEVVTNVRIRTVNKTLARIIFRQDYIQFWGYGITISLVRETVKG